MNNWERPTLWERLEAALKAKENSGMMLPEIRYFDGTDSFSNVKGDYKAKTLEESVELFLEQHGQ
jgi:hypothetical protein